MRYDDYEQYETLFDPLNSDRQARRKRKPRAHHVPKKAQHEVLDEIADRQGLEGGFETTYRPGLFEEAWLLESLRSFYDGALITNVLARVQGGKEASVYRCAGHPSTGAELLAAKVYRPRMFRNLRNDHAYRQGREVLKENGRAVKGNDHRMLRALGKKTDFGQQVAHTSWLMHEFTTLEALHRAGADVPRVYASNGNSILMSYVGQEQIGAPLLVAVELDSTEAEVLFQRVLHNIELMLKQGLVHGDLSAYNILYHEGQITLIDFPQVVPIASNNQAAAILRRDVRRVCEYFARQGVDCDAGALAGRLWARYGGPTAAQLRAVEEHEEE